jgi:hypothetical protein
MAQGLAGPPGSPGAFAVAIAGAMAAGMLAPPAARAQEAGSSAEEAGTSAEVFNHKGQFDVNLQAGFGYRAVFPYDEQFCGEIKDDGSGDNKSPCLGRSPFGIDLALGYGLLDRVELFLQMRLGLESDFGENLGDDGPRAFALSPGIRGYIGELGRGRFFATVQLWLDLTDYAQFDGADVGVRNTNAYQIDLHKTFGIYFFFGEIASWKRWLGFEIEAGVGAQARFP